MYLAPFNYDRFFKKIFSDNDIAKAFLEDFLDVEIEEIQQLGNEHAVTNKSKIVEFDYRCKINGQYVIIDMQQWYKSDVAQRFYIYHALNAALQLEDLKEKVVTIEYDKKVGNKKIKFEKEVKDYRKVEPVLTLVWLVDDSLHFKSDFVSYKLLPDILEAFIKNQQIWFKENFDNLIITRNELIEVVDNEHKDINFLKKNKLIFMFQKNIVKNFENAKKKEEENNIESKDLKYVRWFDFAKKTLKKDNSKEDFEEYQNDPLFKEITRRLVQEELSEEDKEYIQDESDLQEKIKAYNDGVFSDGFKESQILAKKEIKEVKQKADKELDEEKQKTEKEKQKAEKEKQKAEKEKQKAEKAEKALEIEKEKALQEKYQMAIELNNNDMPINAIANITKLSIDKIKQLTKEVL